MKDDALYLEVDEDITSAIDKLTKTPGSSVQIVVPKRSTMLQSIINLKLLKKAAENSGKKLVLVTGDKIATDLAGRVGLAVAPSLGAEAVVRESKVPEAVSSHEEIIEADDPEPPAPPQPVVAAPKPAKKRPLLKRLTVPDGPPPAPAAGAAAAAMEAGAAGAEAAGEAAAGAASSAPKARPAVKVPNFGRLQKRVGWIAAAVILIGGYLGGMYFFATAKVTLFANANRVAIDTTFTVDPAAKSATVADATLPGQSVTFSKDVTAPFTPSGKKDVGTKASGTMTIKNCYDAANHLFVAGTRFQAPDGKIFRSTEDVTVPGGQGSFFGCTTPGQATVNVQADQNGDSYNEAPAKYTLPGLSASQQTGANAITAQGGQMSGGVSKTVTVATQADIDGAKASLLSSNDLTKDLAAKAPSGFVIVSGSQTVATSNLKSTPEADAEGESGSLSLKITATALAVKKADFEAFIKDLEAKQVGDSSQIYDSGLDNAQITSTKTESSGRQTFHFTTEAYSGSKLDETAIKNQLKGQRYGDAIKAASGLPGVARAEVALTPGWANKLPSRPAKIKIVIQVSSTK